MADISKIKLPNGDEYNLKDSDAVHSSDSISRSKVGLDSDQVSGSVDNVSRPMISTVRSNKTFGLPSEQSTIEYSRDGGSSWVNYSLSSSQKIRLFSELRGIQIRLGNYTTTADNNLNNMARITIDSSDRYCSLDCLYVYCSTCGNNWCVDLDASTIENPTVFTNIFTGFQLTGWSGDNIKYFPNILFGWSGLDNQKQNKYALRLTFRQTSVMSTGNYGPPIIYDVRFYGKEVYKSPNSMVKADHLYSWDSAFAGLFPGTIIGGTTDDKTVRYFVCRSNSGDIDLVSNGNADGNGSRSLTFGTHGTGTSKSPISADTNNVISFVGDNLTLTNALPIASGGTGAKTALAATRNLGVFSNQPGGTEIPANADLNTYTTPGVYYSPISTRTRTLSNVPFNVSGFKLFVEGSYSSNYLWQFIIAADSLANKIYYRRRNGSTWTDWGCAYSTTNKPSKADVGLGNVNNVYSTGIVAVSGTQTESTGDWTGNINVNALYDGLTIAYYLPYGVPSLTNVSLELTLSDGTVTPKVPVYYTGTSRATAHYGAGSTVILTYWGAGSININGTVTDSARWTRCDYNTNTTYSVATTSANGLMSSSDKTKLSNISAIYQSSSETIVFSIPN